MFCCIFVNNNKPNKYNIMGRNLKSDNYSRSRKGKKNIIYTLVKGLKDIYPNAIEIELRYFGGCPAGFNFKVEKDGELMQTKFVTK